MSRALAMVPLAEEHPPRPLTRGDCGTARPCRWAETCRYGLEAGACALDVADRGEHTLEAVGELLGGMSREGVRVIERAALEKFTRRALEAGVIERLPRWGERSRAGVAERSPSPPPLPTEADDEEPRRVRERPIVSFFGDDDDAVCGSVWTMLEKRSAPDPYATAGDPYAVGDVYTDEEPKP